MGSKAYRPLGSSVSVIEGAKAEVDPAGFHAEHFKVDLSATNPRCAPSPLELVARTAAVR